MHSLTCPFCQSRFRVPDGTAGNNRRFRCPHCQRILSTQDFPQLCDVVSSRRPAPAAPQAVVKEDQLEIVEDPVYGTEFTSSPAYHYADAPRRSTSDARTIALLCHLGGIFCSVLLCLILWLIKRDQSRFVDEHGKEALNYQLTILIVFLIAFLLRWFLSLFMVMGFFAAPLPGTLAGSLMLGFVISMIWILAILALFVMNLIFSIQGAMAASNGRMYRYPFSLRMVK